MTAEGSGSARVMRDTVRQVVMRRNGNSTSGKKCWKRQHRTAPGRMIHVADGSGSKCTRWIQTLQPVLTATEIALTYVYIQPRLRFARAKTRCLTQPYANCRARCSRFGSERTMISRRGTFPAHGVRTGYARRPARCISASLSASENPMESRQRRSIEVDFFRGIVLIVIVLDHIPGSVLSHVML